MIPQALPPARVFTMPALAPAAARTLQLLRQPRVDSPRIVRAMEADPAWTQDVLRLAGLGVWGRTGTPADLPGAIGQLGLRRFAQVAAVSAVAPILRAPLPGYDLAEGGLWGHSLAVAFATREILLEKGLRPCEEAFTAALLHDVGKVVIGSVLEGEAPWGLGDDPAFEEAEMEAAGIDHAAAGAILLEHWKLPYWLVTAVRYHHAPLTCSFVVADLVHLAEALCLGAGLGEEPGRLRRLVCPEGAMRWTLSERSLDRILGRTREALGEARDLRFFGERS